MKNIIKNPTIKAVLATLLFFFIGVFELQNKLDYIYIIPVAIFYFTLTLNTYFSIKLFAKITPEDDIIQNLIDFVLVLLYVCVALTMNNILYFTFFLLILFITATAKYAFLLNRTNHPKLFKNKILVDTSGTLACTVTLGGIIMGYGGYSIWGLSLAFVIANILLFLIFPLYRFDNQR